MRVRFTKMHGLGNDFVVLDARDAALPELSRETIRRIAHRHEGIGCDQLIVLEPAQGEADCAMRIFNADGGEAGACGNASRAVALLIGRRARIATAGGLIEAVPQHSGGASVDMGVPRFEWDAIPLAYALDTQALPLAWESLANPAAVNVGNPHAVFFVEDVEAVPLAKLGPIIETDPVFAEGVNVNVASVESAERIRLRVWERGAARPGRGQ
jgi:diaminopimelate epimerase